MTYFAIGALIGLIIGIVAATYLLHVVDEIQREIDDIDKDLEI